MTSILAGIAVKLARSLVHFQQVTEPTVRTATTSCSPFSRSTTSRRRSCLRSCPRALTRRWRRSRHHLRRRATTQFPGTIAVAVPRKLADNTHPKPAPVGLGEEGTCLGLRPRTKPRPLAPSHHLRRPGNRGMDIRRGLTILPKHQRPHRGAFFAFHYLSGWNSQSRAS